MRDFQLAGVVCHLVTVLVDEFTCVNYFNVCKRDQPVQIAAELHVEGLSGGGTRDVFVVDQPS